MRDKSLIIKKKKNLCVHTRECQTLASYLDHHVGQKAAEESPGERKGHANRLAKAMQVGSVQHGWELQSLAPNPTYSEATSTNSSPLPKQPFIYFKDQDLNV